MGWLDDRAFVAVATRDFYGRPVVYTCQGHAAAPIVAIVEKPGVRDSQDGNVTPEIDGVAWILDVIAADLPATPRAGDTVSIPGLGTGSFEVVAVEARDSDALNLSLIEV